jgi:hypothetical protein
MGDLHPFNPLSTHLSTRPKCLSAKRKTLFRWKGCKDINKDLVGKKKKTKNKRWTIYKGLHGKGPTLSTPPVSRPPAAYANTLNSDLETCRTCAGKNPTAAARTWHTGAKCLLQPCAVVSCRCRHPVNPSP